MLDSYWPIFILVVIVAIESSLSATWNAIYFRWGIPVYIQRIRCQDYLNPISDTHDIEAAIQKNPLISDMLVHSFDNNTFAFREKFTKRSNNSYAPIMHGIIRFNPTTNEVTATGYLNVFPSLLILIMLYAFAPQTLSEGMGFLLFPLFTGGFLFFLYLLQRKKFNAILKLAASQRSETK